MSDVMDTQALQDALSEYISVLANSADETTRANDRTLYDRHLAEAARMFAFLRVGDIAGARECVAKERQAFGRAFLAGAQGEAAESAWNRFACLVEAWRPKA